MKHWQEEGEISKGLLSGPSDVETSCSPEPPRTNRILLLCSGSLPPDEQLAASHTLRAKPDVLVVVLVGLGFCFLFFFKKIGSVPIMYKVGGEDLIFTAKGELSLCLPPCTPPIKAFYPS